MNVFRVLAMESFVERVLFWPAIAAYLLSFVWSVRDAIQRNQGRLLVKSALLLGMMLHIACVKLLRMQGIGFERSLPAGAPSVNNVLMNLRDAIPVFVCICFLIWIAAWWMDPTESS